MFPKRGVDTANSVPNLSPVLPYLIGSVCALRSHLFLTGRDGIACAIEFLEMKDRQYSIVN